MNVWIMIYILALVLSAFFAGIVIPKILLIAFRKRLFDEPDDRKIHHCVVPRLGGIAFTPVICFTLSLIAGIGLVVAPSIIQDMLSTCAVPISLGFCASLMLYLAGMSDDLVGIRYRAKFWIQIGCALLLIIGGISMNNLHGILGLYELPVYLYVPITILAIVFVINAFNLIDGIDGLCSGLAAATFVIYGVWHALLGQAFYAILSFATLGVLLPFFYYNVFGDPDKQKKIFMGDTGSLTIGFLITFVGLKLMNSDAHAVSTVCDYNLMVVVISPLVIPCFDVVRVFMHRLRNHNNPFLPDNCHIHHKLLALGLPQRLIMVVIVSSSIVLSLVSIILSKYLDINLILLIAIFAWTGCNILLSRAIKKRHINN